MRTNSYFSRMGRFFKRNAYYVVLFVCIAGIATMITLAALRGGTGNPPTVIDNNNTPPPVDTDEDKGTDVLPVKFALPIQDFEQGLTYSGNEFLYYTTIAMWKTHPAMDFKAPEGTDVKAVYGGVVKSIISNYFDGTYIEIEINEELTTVYRSIEPISGLQAGDTVKTGDVIGKVANTMLKEYSEGPHLHLEVLLNGKFTDPAAYFDLGDDK